MTTLDFLRLSSEERDAAYNNMAAVADSAHQLAQFDVRSQAWMARSAVCADLRYGTADRQLWDYFAGPLGADTLLFIHGGYWQSRHKDSFRFIAEGPMGHGLSVALIGYSLAPQARMDAMVQEVRQGVAAVRSHAQEHGGNGRILLCGWSAGAHLAAMALDCEGVVAGLGISGIYDLEPVRHTALNTALQLSEEDVRHLSPLRHPPVAKPFVVAYGALELPQLKAQSEAFACHRQTRTEHRVCIEHADHFSVLNALAQPQSELLRTLLQASTAIAAD